MKTRNNFRKTETFEDLVFEGRNKTYGAFELNHKSRKYLIVAFLIAFTGVSTAIAVPFINSLMNNGRFISIPVSNGVTITTVNPYDDDVLPPPPPPPPVIDKITSTLRYRIPVVVETAIDDPVLIMPEDVTTDIANSLVDINPIPTPVDSAITDDIKPEEPMLFPAEPAVFMDCPDISCFHKWVSEHVTFPQVAADAGIKGKVIVEFCVNKTGQVVDVKILRRLDEAIDDETVKVISSSPQWKPAKQGGHPVIQRFVIPFMFELR